MCDTYWSGHQVHWIAVKHAHRSQRSFGRLSMAGEQVMFVADDGSEVELHHHDQHRLDDLARERAHGQLHAGQHLLQWAACSGSA